MRRTSAIIAAVCLLLITHAATWWFAAQAGTPEQRAADSAAPPPSQITVDVDDMPVERTVLADCRAEARHTLAPDLSVSVAEGSTPVVTGTPVAAGDQLDSGALLAEVSSRPVIMLKGDVPVFRTMSVGTRGVDVTQLHTALRSLSLYAGPVDAPYSVRTGAAVEKLYERLGYDAQRSDADSEQALADAEAALRDFDGDTTGEEYRDLVRTRDRAAEAAAAAAPANEIVFVPAQKATVTRVAYTVGQPPARGQLILSAGEDVEKCRIAATALTTVQSGQHAHISGVTAESPATVHQVIPPQDGGHSPAEETGGDAHGAESGDDPAASAADATVILELPDGTEPAAGAARIVIEAGPDDALRVPAAAVHMRSSGETYIDRIAGEETEPVVVTVVFEADGYAAVQSAQLKKGDRIVIHGRGR